MSTGQQNEFRAYHFGSQGPGSVFSNHASHSNRLVPVYVFAGKADLGAVIGKNSRYRDAEKIKRVAISLRAEYANDDGVKTILKK